MCGTFRSHHYPPTVVWTHSNDCVAIYTHVSYACLGFGAVRHPTVKTFCDETRGISSILYSRRARNMFAAASVQRAQNTRDPETLDSARKAVAPRHHVTNTTVFLVHF
jgi:hypothetical protein